MKVSQAFLGVNKVFLDTAPIIYYVEGTPGFGEVVREVFNLLAQGRFQAHIPHPDCHNRKLLNINDG